MLSPNTSGHWRKKLPYKQDARKTGFWLTMESIGYLSEKPNGVTIKFYPPDNRKRDDDNVIASFKSYRDGIADAVKWDDKHWRPNYQFCEPEKPGRVEVIFE
jgi:crossover junction endodeoxyribonuclease RusA